MSNQGGNSYNLIETQEKDERNWHAQMEQCMVTMEKTYQKVIHDMNSAQDQKLADMTQSQEKNMACTRADIDHLMEEGADSVTVVAIAVVLVVDRD
ncbi:hypothetical protein Syun_001462 [Stephania yunnanensis]|uniref:Uncharacterized protein n=1 Tax=Stephania yunnanensis TaxID=152371 RepID=A0AAP0LFR3_9MAGN